MELTGIAIFYFACLVFGFLFALLGAIFGELLGHFHADVGGHGVELDHGGVHIEHGVDHADAGAAGEVHAGPIDAQHMPGASVFNTITISTFLAFFGMAGLGAVWGLRLSPVASLAFALPTAMLIAAGQFTLFVKVFIKAQASSEVTLSEILGCEAEVLASIPGDRVGQIAYTIKGSRYTSPAVSADGEDIPRGTKVNIVNTRGTTLVVRPM